VFDEISVENLKPTAAWSLSSHIVGSNPGT